MSSKNKHFTMTDKNGESFISIEHAPEFSAADYSGWEAISVEAEAAGLFFFMFKVAPNAEEFPLHASPDTWLSYVVSGHGLMYAGKENGVKTQGVEFKAGDFISFGPNTQHAWKNGDAETKIMFLKRA